MTLLIRPYTEIDVPVLQKLTAELQDHIAQLDPLKLNRPKEDFDAAAYVTQIIEGLQRRDGTILVAEQGETVLGYIAGGVSPQRESALLDRYPVTEGWIEELAVCSDARSKGIGRKLVEEFEAWLRTRGCRFVRVGCFSPNVRALTFYRNMGFEDRTVEFIKDMGAE